MREIYKKEYVVWWFAFAVVIAIKFVVFGNASNSIFNTATYENYGIVYKIVAILLWTTVFGSLIKWIYKFFSKRYNPKIHLIIIGIMILLALLVL